MNVTTSTTARKPASDIKGTPEDGRWGLYFPRPWVNTDGLWGKVSPSARAVLPPLLFFMNASSKLAWPGQGKYLAPLSGLSRKAVINGIRCWEVEGKIIRGGYKGRARKYAFHVPDKTECFRFASEILTSHVWADLSGDAKGVYVALRAAAWDAHVHQLWGDEKADFRRKEFYLAWDSGEVDFVLKGAYENPVGGYYQPLKPYIEITPSARKRLAKRAGIEDSNVYRRNNRFKRAATELIAVGLAAETVYDYPLIFPLPKPGIWGE